MTEKFENGYALLGVLGYDGEAGDKQMFENARNLAM